MATWISALNGVGTLMVAIAVAWLGFHQYRSDQLFRAAQTNLLRQDLRVKLLGERSAVIEDFRSIQAQHFREAVLDDEGIQRVSRVTQRAALLFGQELSGEINELSDVLLKHKIVSRRVAALLEHDPQGRYQKKVDEQFDLEERIWSSLGPLSDKLVAESRVSLD